VVLQAVVDCRHQFGHSPEHPTADAILGNQAEEALGLFEPASRGGGEMHVGQQSVAVPTPMRMADPMCITPFIHAPKRQATT
jgi:hypothetical protein